MKYDSILEKLGMYSDQKISAYLVCTFRYGEDVIRGKADLIDKLGRVDNHKPSIILGNLESTFFILLDMPS